MLTRHHGQHRHPCLLWQVLQGIPQQSSIPSQIWQFSQQSSQRELRLASGYGIIAVALLDLHGSNLHHIEPNATHHDIRLGMFADDLTAWTTGRSLRRLEVKLTGLTKLISKWTKPHNMQLSKKKGKCSTLQFTNSRQDPPPKVQLDGETLLPVKKFKLLGVILDAQLTMKLHFEKLVK